MKYRDLRGFLAGLEERGELRTLDAAVDPVLEMTEISSRVLKKGGPALLFAKPKGSSIRALTNLFGTSRRIALAMGRDGDPVEELRAIGDMLAELRSPTPPSGIEDLTRGLPLMKSIFSMAPKRVKKAPCQELRWEGSEVDLGLLPVQTCWPGDAGPLITWGLTLTKGPRRARQNAGVYRQQVIAANKIIMRWLAHRGGALDYADWQSAHGDKPFPLAVAIGADPATLLAAATPIPDSLSEQAFAGLLRGSRTELAPALHCPGLLVPATAEIILEGQIHPGETADEGPFGDHTGYYNDVEPFPVMTVERVTMRPEPIYHSTYTGRPPDEPAVLGVALNEMLVPMLRRQFPELVDFYLPPEGCSYRVAVISMKKAYAGHARRLMFAVWSFLRQFLYTKFIIVVDDSIDARNWPDVIWALSTRVDPARDVAIVENTPIDYLDFASPAAGLGSKMGIDATNKIDNETQRTWGRPLSMSEDARRRVDDLWSELGL